MNTLKSSIGLGFMLLLLAMSLNTQDVLDKKLFVSFSLIAAITTCHHLSNKKGDEKN